MKLFYIVKKLYILIFILEISLFAQSNSVNEALKYYPLQIGNYWEYKGTWFQGITSGSIRYTVQVIGDTLLSNNNEYKILFVHNFGGSSFELYERVDTLTACVYRYTNDSSYIDNEVLVDSLLAQPGDYFVATGPSAMYGYGSSYFLLSTYQCVAEYEDTLENLNVITEVKKNQKSTSNYYTLAKGLGYLNHYTEGGSIYNYFWRSVRLDSVFINEVTEYSGEVNLPKEFVLFQNYPNPFNPKTTISYALTKRGLTQLKVYDVLGKELAVLVNEEQSIGNHNIEFDGTNLPSGVYFYHLTSGDFTDTKKLILLK